MSNLSELLPAGGAAKEFEVVASGTLPNGSPVVMKSDGTVEVVAESSTSGVAIPAGSPSTFNAGTTTYPSLSFDPNNAGKFVVAYADGGNSEYGTAIVGTVSGTSITFGSEYIFTSVGIRYASVSFDPNTSGKFVVTWQVTSGEYGKAIVGTVSGTSISYGSEVTFNAAQTWYGYCAFDPNTANKFMVVYSDEGNGSYGTAIIGTVSGTSISFGSEYVVDATHTINMEIAWDPSTTGKAIITHRYYGGGVFYGKATVATVSGTSITFGSATTFNSGSTNYISVAYDPSTAGKFVVAYRDKSNSNYGTAIVGTVSGTSVSFGAEVVFHSGSMSYTSIAFDPATAGKALIAYRSSTDGEGAVEIGTVSGTSITFGSSYVFSSPAVAYTAIAFDPNNAGEFVISYRDADDSNYGKAVLNDLTGTIVTTNLTSTNFAGTSTAAFTNGQTATIVPQGGVSTNQTSLTIGSTYYVQPAGTLATSAGDPSVVAGKAISATSLILKGNS